MYNFLFDFDFSKAINFLYYKALRVTLFMKCKCKNKSIWFFSKHQN